MDYDLFNNPNNGLLSEISQDRMNSAPPSQGMYLQVAYQILAKSKQGTDTCSEFFLEQAMIWDSISKKIMDLIPKFILPVMMVRKPGIYGKIPHRDIIFRIMVSDLWNTYYIIPNPSYTCGYLFS